MANLGYNGNSKLRKAYTQISMSQYEIDEFEKCMLDPLYFVKTYVKIVVLGKGLQPFSLYPFQEDMINTFIDERFVICKIPRQSGKSITTVAFLLHSILFNNHYNVAILAHKGSAANGLLGRLKLAYENLPTWLQSGIVEWNKGNIELENGSKIGAFATSADGLRSGSYDAILLDEFAFVPDNIAEEFFESTYPVISAGNKTKIIIVSTPKGMNHFYTSWIRATKKLSDYVPIEVHWSAVPGRDEAWKQQTIRNTSEEQFKQEFETEFVGSSSTLISGGKITQLMSLMENPVRRDGYVDIYQKPQEGHTYVMSVDVAEGQELDYSCFSIIDVTNLPYVQVAKYRNNKISPLLYPTEIYRWAREYNEAFILVEINSIGLQVADLLYNDFNYENMIRIKPASKTGQKMSAGSKKTNLGLKQSVQTKKIGCANLKILMETDKLITIDSETISEFTTFVISKSSYAAEAGKNDDLVMTLVNFAWLTSQSYFRDNVGQDIRSVLQKEQMNIIDSEMMPMIVMDDGLRNLDNDQYMDDREIWLQDVSRNYPLDDLNYDWGYNRRF
jgi:hypothetical protein